MSGLALRWVVTILFGASIAVYVYLLGAQRRRSTNAASHLLHLTMSAAMILMAWDVEMYLPTAGAITFFLLAGLWFAGAAGRASAANGDRLTNAYYALMMGAMAWMITLMNGSLPGLIGRPSGHAPSAAMAMDASGTEMTSAPDMSSTGSGAEWITAVNWIATLGFAVVAMCWAGSYVARRRMSLVAQTRQLTCLEPLNHVCTAAGTAVMFGALL